ncbi:MAG TPA: hypothetical protein PK467_01785 [Candidatus Wallbacteria bacterium]|nr:hypothetical protein [Candidatus Wallbacteria bacterium]
MKKKEIILSLAPSFFGDNVNTDLIHAPSNFTINRDRLHSDYVGPKNKDTDKNPERIIIAGENFGLGSSRFSTVIALKNSGVRIVAADSISRIFERNLACCAIFAFRFAPGIKAAEYFNNESQSVIEVKIEPRAQKAVALIKQAGGKKTAEAFMDIYLYRIAAAGGMVNYIACKK